MLRCTECDHLKSSHLLHNGQFMCLGAGADFSKAKGKEARVLPVPDWLWGKLWVFPRPSLEWVFPATDGVPHRSGYLRKPLARLCKALGLGNVTQHRLRASFATLHAEAGTTITEIQGMLGHKNIQTTMLYVEQSLDVKRNAQFTLSQRLGLG